MFDFRLNIKIRMNLSITGNEKLEKLRKKMLLDMRQNNSTAKKYNNFRLN